MNVSLVKPSQRKLNDDVIARQIAYACSRMLGAGRGKVWTTGRPKIDLEESQEEYLYHVTIPIRRTGRDIPKQVQEAQVARMQELAEAALRSKGWTKNGVLPSDKPEQPKESPFAPVSVNTDPKDHFAHLFGLDAQISLVLSSVEEYIRSDHVNRFHSVLFGDPACGKTEILRSLSRMLGPNAVMHFDATSTTSAGAKQLLTEAAHIPPVLCIEEIEKADEQSLRWLLGVLDYRAEVRHLKFRSGLVTKEVKLLCLATVNDFPLFNRMMDGALASRFSHKIRCPRPSQAVLQMILEREIAKHNGNAAWIAPALDWCLNREKTNDPRRIITVCLCGRDKLLTGEYQKLLAATMDTK